MDASVIVRARDEVTSIETTFRALRSQSRAVEIVVVDSGSTDGTLDVARTWADVVVQVPPERFSYGGALNAGAGAASGQVHFALSAHCHPRQDTWVQDSLQLHEELGVAATCGATDAPDGRPLVGVCLPTLQEVLAHPAWGFSNHASSWSADTWRAAPFREDLGACEDKEWSWRVLAAGGRIAFSRDLFVPSDHRREQGLLALHRRVAREAEAMVVLGVARPLTAPEAVRAWWGSFSRGRRPDPLRRLSPHRLVELLGAWSGARAAQGGVHCAVPPLGLPTQDAVPAYLPWVPAPRR